MAQTGFTPIVTYNTATATTVPSAANLAQGELAVNVTDKKLYTKDSGGNVILLASNGGDVTGPASSTNLAIPTFSGTGGKTLLNNSGVTITAGIVSGTGFTGALNGSLGATTPSTVVATNLSVTGNINGVTTSQVLVVSAASGTAYSLGVTVEGGSYGTFMQIFITDQWDAGNATRAAMYFIRCGYNGANYTATYVTGNNNFTFSLSGTTLQVTQTGIPATGLRATIIRG
jgi:hypothetical protein